MNQTNAVYMNTQRMFYSCQSFSFKLQIIYSLHLTVFLFLATVQIRLQGEATVSKTCLVFFFLCRLLRKQTLAASRQEAW